MHMCTYNNICLHREASVVKPYCTHTNYIIDCVVLQINTYVLLVYKFEIIITH